MNHMSLEEWDRRVAPYLATISARAVQMQRDAKQILDWVNLMPAAPAFPTEAIDRLQTAQNELEAAINAIAMALDNYAKKEKVS